MGEKDHLAGLVFLGAALLLALSIAAWCTHDGLSAAPGPEPQTTVAASASGMMAGTWSASAPVRIVWTGTDDAGSTVHTR